MWPASTGRGWLRLRSALPNCASVSVPDDSNRFVSEMALVCATDGVLLVLVDDTQESLDRRLAEWAADRAACVLWPADAQRMRDLVGCGLIAESICWYFTRVGQRW